MDTDPDSARLGDRSAANFIYAMPRGEKSTDLLQSMLANQNQMLDNQRKMMHMIIETISNVEYISQNIKVAARADAPRSNAEKVPPMPIYCPSKIMEPVNSVETLKALEESLKDDRTMQKYVNSMTFICGNSGRANGIDCCYKLVDYFITRQFLLQCSWTGNCRILGASKMPGDFGDLPDGESGKVALKFYRKFRTLFLNLIMLADNTFTEMQCEMFFKRIMKNSKQRMMSKMTTSKHRNRPKNLKYNIQRPSTSSEPLSGMAENNDPFDDVASSHSECSVVVDFPQQSSVVADFPQPSHAAPLFVFHDNR